MSGRKKLQKQIDELRLKMRRQDLNNEVFVQHLDAVIAWVLENFDDECTRRIRGVGDRWDAAIAEVLEARESK